MVECPKLVYNITLILTLTIKQKNCRNHDQDEGGLGYTDKIQTISSEFYDLFYLCIQRLKPYILTHLALFLHSTYLSRQF